MMILGSRLSVGQMMPRALLVAFVAFLLVVHLAGSQQDFTSRKQQKRESSGDFLSQTGSTVRETMDAWIGREIMHAVAETSSQVLWAISSAISVAFLALSGISAQLLNALGLEGDHLTHGFEAQPGPGTDLPAVGSRGPCRLLGAGPVPGLAVGSAGPDPVGPEAVHLPGGVCGRGQVCAGPFCPGPDAAGPADPVRSAEPAHRQPGLGSAARSQSAEPGEASGRTPLEAAQSRQVLPECRGGVRGWERGGRGVTPKSPALGSGSPLCPLPCPPPRGAGEGLPALHLLFLPLKAHHCRGLGTALQTLGPWPDLCAAEQALPLPPRPRLSLSVLSRDASLWCPPGGPRPCFPLGLLSQQPPGSCAPPHGGEDVRAGPRALGRFLLGPGRAGCQICDKCLQSSPRCLLLACCRVGTSILGS